MGQQNETLAANIRAEMGRRRVSQKTLATALGLTQSGVSKRLSGTVDWSVSELTSMAEFLNVPVSALLGEVAA